jgi:hypothetical protein
MSIVEQDSLKSIQGVQGTVKKSLWLHDGETVPVITKSSKNIDFILELESAVWTKLNYKECIHFCPIYKTDSERIIMKEITHLQDGKFIQNTLGNAVYYFYFEPRALYNCILQSMYSIGIFHQSKITHYDLHSDNIMIGNTPYDVHVYGNEPVQTFGIVPVIIDFGMAYCEGYRFCSTIEFNSSGFTPYMFDPLVDARLLLMTLVKDLKENIYKRKDTDVLQQFTKEVKNTFRSLNLKDNGWFHKNSFINIKDSIEELKPRSLKNSKYGIFKKENFLWCLELLQHMFTVPLDHKNNNSFRDNKLTKKYKDEQFMLAVLEFAEEWFIVEQILSDTKKEKVFLKDLVCFRIRTGECGQPFLLHNRKDHILFLRKKYPGITNFCRIYKTLIHLAKAYFVILENTRDKTLEQRNILYGSVKNKNIYDILNNLHKNKIIYKSGMKVYFVHENKCVVINAALAELLNYDDKVVLKSIRNIKNIHNTDFP